MLSGAFAGLIFCLASIQSDFSSSLCVETFTTVQRGWLPDAILGVFQDPGLGEGFLALKRPLGDAGRLQCVWPPEEIFFSPSVVRRACTDVLGTVVIGWRVSGRKTSPFYLADI